MSISNPETNYIKVPLSEGLNSTLRVMRELEQRALAEPMFVKWIIQNFRQSCGVCQLKKVWEYVRKNFTYLDDEYDEVLISPAIIISQRFGDCDDFALFIHTCFTALNIPCKYILLGAEKNKPTHIAVHALATIVDGTNDKFNFIPSKYKFYSLV